MTTQPPKCAHLMGVAWFSPDKSWHESEKLAGRGHWECKECMAMVEFPAGTGMCRICLKPLDAHDDVGTPHQVCWPTSKGAKQ